jgi:hypothetical protein
MTIVVPLSVIEMAANCRNDSQPTATLFLNKFFFMILEITGSISMHAERVLNLI